MTEFLPRVDRFAWVACSCLFAALWRSLVARCASFGLCAWIAPVSQLGASARASEIAVLYRVVGIFTRGFHHAERSGRRGSHLGLGACWSLEAVGQGGPRVDSQAARALGGSGSAPPASRTWLQLDVRLLPDCAGDVGSRGSLAYSRCEHREEVSSCSGTARGRRAAFDRDQTAGSASHTGQSCAAARSRERNDKAANRSASRRLGTEARCSRQYP